MKESSVNIIFAVTEEQFDVYNLLKENIEGSSAGTLSNDSSNIVELVKAQYQVVMPGYKRPAQRPLPPMILCS